MIRRLKYHEIDFVKYTECLENSEQIKYSAAALFLDITADKKWEILVYGDYEAVMPVPYIRKFGCKIVVNPKLCQQLGVFSVQDNPERNGLFMNFLEQNYNIWYYAFNDGNTFDIPLKQRKNFLIYPGTYEQVRQRYSPKRKRKLRLDGEVLAESHVRNISISEARSFIQEHLIGAANEKDRSAFLSIFQNFADTGHLVIPAFLYKGKIINALAIYQDERTIALLGTFNDREFVKLSGSCVLIDHMIRQTIEHKIFDFEGSEVPSIEEFFRGFRPELKPYGVIMNSKKDLVKRFLGFRKR